MDEDDLVNRAIGGEEQAWELITARHSSYLRSIGWKYRLSQDETSDAMQETWLCAVAALPRLRDASKLRSWLATTMRRQCMRVIHGRCRGISPLEPAFTADHADSSEEVDKNILASERASAVRQAVALLPERDRELIRELTSDDPGYDRIASRLSLPRGSIGPRRMRIIQRLRNAIQQAQGTDFCLDR
jgi:RNA polymerase sigma factor (sigma-70 family)